MRIGPSEAKGGGVMAAERINLSVVDARDLAEGALPAIRLPGGQISGVAS
jgi:hypothetical protein